MSGKRDSFTVDLYMYVPLIHFDFDIPLGVPQFLSHWLSAIYGQPPIPFAFRSPYRTWRGGGLQTAEILGGNR